MTIGVLIDELLPGGFQKVALMEAANLVELGYNAKLVVLHRTHNIGYQDIIAEYNVDVVFLSDRLPWYLKINFRFPLFSFFSFFHISYYFFISRYLESDEFDIFVVHGTYTAFSSIAINKNKGIPYIAFIHDPITYILRQKYKYRVLNFFLPVLLPMAKLLDRKIIENSKIILAYPEMIGPMKRISSGDDKYQSIWNGCKPIDKSKIQYNKSNYAIAVSKWDEGKNLELLLEVWSKLDKSITLKIIGSWHPEKLKIDFINKIKLNGLEKYIKVVGGVSEKQLYEYYQKAKFLIHPCREAFGMTILEAAANGCPAIFTSNSGVAKLFDKNECLLVKENSISDYKQMIEIILTNSVKKEKTCIDEYYNVALENSWDIHCKKILQYFN